MAAPPPSSQEGLVALLQDSISYIEQNEFHPVLYEAMGALHQFCMGHLTGDSGAQCLGLSSSSSSFSPTAVSSSVVARPSFSRQCRDDNVVASGWLEIWHQYKWESVLLILMAPPTDDNDDKKSECHHLLRVAREEISASHKGASPGLTTLYQFSIPKNLVSCQYVDFYGDPRLNIYVVGTESEFTLQFRSQTASAAMNWSTTLQSIVPLKPETGEDAVGEDFADAQEEEQQDDDESSIHTSSESDTELNNIGGQSVEVEMGGSKNDIVHLEKEDYHVRHLSSSSSSLPAENTESSSVKDQEQAEAKHYFSHNEQRRDTQKNNLQTAHGAQQTNSKIQGEPKTKEIEEKKLETTDAALPPPSNPSPSVASAKQHAHVTPVGKPTPPTSAKQAATPTQRRASTQAEREWNVEQQKKATAEKRRQEVDLQRKLARADQKRKDLEQKRRFLDTEQRKEGLKQKAGNQDAAFNLKKIGHQITTVESELKQQQAEVAKIKAEIQEHKQRPLEAFIAKQKDSPAVTQQRLAAEQARREQELERQKKSAFEKHRLELERQRKLAREEQKRKELEKKRRFLEEEQRKQNLVTNAATKAEKTTTMADDSGLLKKLSKQMSALDEEVERQKAEQAKKEAEAEVDQVEDADAIRKRISEQARQREVQNEIERPPHHKIPSDVDPFAHLSTSGSMEEENGGNTYPNLHQPSPPSSSSNFYTNHHQQSASQSSFDTTNQHFSERQQHDMGANSQQNFHQHFGSTARKSPLYGSAQPHQPHHHNTSHPSHSDGHDHKGSSGPAAAAPGGSSTPAPSYQSGQARTKAAPEETNDMDNVDEGSNTNATTTSSFDKEGLKRKILVGWALQPPMLQTLRPIDQLVCDIQKVFHHSSELLLDDGHRPLPANHSYFDSWKIIARADLGSAAVRPDEKKLNKAVRKVKTFLHPDKLPRDLTDEQQFMCKLLWDVIQDAWEEHKKAKEELDWMN